MLVSDALPKAPSRRGFCLILSSPSGAGKTTLVKRLLAAESSLTLSISATTRPMRKGEREGVDYFFKSRDEFQALKEAGGLLEWAEVFGNLYGTLRHPVETALAQGRDVVFDIDWQGAAALASRLPADTARVFILPPSRRELRRRIHGRAADSKAAIERRLRAANYEMSHWRDYDYLIVNRDLDESLAALTSILTAERLKRHRQPDAAAFVDSLMAEEA